MSNAPLHTFESAKPFDDWVVARMYEHQESAGGIHIPESARAGCPPFLEIVEVGPGPVHPVTGNRVPPQFKVGDFIVAVKAHFPKLYVNGETLFVLRIENVAMKVELGEKQKQWVKTYKDELETARQVAGAQRAGLTVAGSSLIVPS